MINIIKRDGNGNIEVNRGNYLPLRVSTTDNVTGSPYKFKANDVLKFTITEKGNCKAVVFQKRVTVPEDCDSVDIVITADEMKIGEILSKPVVYWYEVELNPDTPEAQIIIGYTKAKGAKTLTLTPESGDKNE